MLHATAKPRFVARFAFFLGFVMCAEDRWRCWEAIYPPAAAAWSVVLQKQLRRWAIVFDLYTCLACLDVYFVTIRFFAHLPCKLCNLCEAIGWIRDVYVFSRPRHFFRRQCPQPWLNRQWDSCFCLGSFGPFMWLGAQGQGRKGKGKGQRAQLRLRSFLEHWSCFENLLFLEYWNIFWNTFWSLLTQKNGKETVSLLFFKVSRQGHATELSERSRWRRCRRKSESPMAVTMVFEDKNKKHCFLCSFCFLFLVHVHIFWPPGHILMRMKWTKDWNMLCSLGAGFEQGICKWCGS